MKKFKHIIRNIALLLVLIIAAISCENDFATIDSDIVGGDNFLTDNQTFPITTFTQKLPPIQTNGLPNYLLGHFNDPFYGGSTASIVTQMSPPQFNPTFGDSIVLDSVVLTIPYFSTQTGFDDEDGSATFRLDSLYGNSPIILSIHENNFFLRDFDPNAEVSDSQRYFSNGTTAENELIPQSQLEGILFYQDSLFTPSSDPITLTEINEDNDTIVSEVLPPSLRVKLNNPNDSFWQELILNREGDVELSNLNNFNNHFRGIYIKSEAIDGNGNMALLNLSSAEANITLYFNSQIFNDTQQNSSFVMNFTGNTVNIFENNFVPISTGDSQNGDSELFLKGGEGSIAVINLFNGDDDGNSDELTDFRNIFLDPLGNPISLVNEAFIEFQVDQTRVNGEEPDRVYIYDLNNNIPLLDFALDQLADESVSGHLRPLVRLDNEPDGEGLNYRIRITEHINNLILRDSTNVKLGLTVMANVDNASTINQDLQNENLVEVLPTGSILSPRGTVLYGSNHPDESKRPVFRVFFTDPNPDEDDN